MNSNFYIYPAVKHLIRYTSLALLLCASGIVCYHWVVLTSLFSDKILINPVGLTTTYLTVQYFASLLLTCIAFWSINVLLAGRGTPFIRLAGYTALVLIPVSMFSIHAEAPVLKAYSYLTDIWRNNPVDGHVDSFFEAMLNAGIAQYLIICIISLLAFPYTKAYPPTKRYLLIFWGITGVISALLHWGLHLHITNVILIPLSTLNIVYYAFLISNASFWAATIPMAFKLARLAPDIASMPDNDEILSSNN